MSSEIMLDWMKEPFHTIDTEEERERKQKKRNYKIIDEHMHVGMEVGGPRDVKEMWISHSVREGPEEKVFGCMGMRNTFVQAGRWDKKYMDPKTIPPYTVDDIIWMLDDAGIDKTIMVGRDYQAQVPPYRHMVAHTEYICRELRDKYPDRLVAMGNCNPWDPGTVYNIKSWVEDFGIKAVGEIHISAGIYPNDRKRCYPIYEKCVEYDIPVFIHIGGGLSGRGFGGGAYPGQFRYVLPYEDYMVYPTSANSGNVECLGYDFPDLKIVMHNHWPYLLTTTRLCMQFKNMYTQVGYWALDIERNEDPWMKNYAAGKDWYLYCQKRLPDKVMFGTDTLWGFPQKMTIQYLESIPEFTDEFKKKFFETNVKKVYNI